jgi:hypothetical protein
MIHYPEKIEDLNFGKLTNTHCFVLGDYMGIRNQIMQLKSVETRREALKQKCFLNELSKARAQEGYDILVLKKTAGDKSAVAPDVERRVYEMIAQLMKENDDEWRERGKTGVAILIDAVKKEMNGYAKKALAEASENFRPIAIVEPGKKPRKMKTLVLPPEFERIVQLASQRKPIMMVGPAGCGKTFIAECVAEALGLEFSDQSCSEGMSESVFNGLLLPIGNNGAFKHVPSPFMRRYEHGGVQLLDEIDAGDPNLFTYINKAIANTSYTVAQRWTDPVVKKHADFVLIAAANTFGHGSDTMYVGRNQLDAATLDRFKVGLITMDYSREVEKSLAPDELCEWAWKIRDQIRAHKLRRIMSTRTIKDLADMTAAYKWDRKQWEDTFFVSWPANEKAMVLS